MWKSVAIILLFIFVRFWNLPASFFFFNDMGRDMSVLQLWQQSGKPPLLGPQTSTLPFNQSAIYFYLLYPLFILFKGNPTSSLFTLAFVYLASFITGLYLLRKDKRLTLVLLVSFFLISIHPQYITQSRFVWNPSFLTPFLITSSISFYLLLKKYTLPRLVIFSASIALAVSISYSVAPLLILFFVFWLLFDRRHFIKLFLSLFISFFIINLPTLVFELRHHFLLSSSLFTKTSPVQEGLDFTTRFNRLSQFIFTFSNNQTNQSLFIISILICLLALYFYRQKTKDLLFICSFLYIGITILAFITPVSIQAHYVFAFTSLIFIIISLLPKILLLPIILYFSLSYLQTKQLNVYFSPPLRTYSQMESCFQNFCQNFKDPIFVSTQASFHPFHNGPEHRYLLRKNACNVRDIETQNGEAQYMLVVEDNDKLTPQTHYYELDLFGKYQEFKYFPCTPTFNLRLIEKVNDPPTSN